jgi:hypothetical protein
MKKLFFCLLTVIFSAGFLTACEEDEPEVEFTAIGRAAGEWWVTYKEETRPGVFEDKNQGYTGLMTYNASDNSPNQIWLDDRGHFWPFKFKAAYDGTAMSFSASNAPSLVKSNNQNFTANVTAGKVIVGGGKSKTKAATDSIYFQVEFSDDPGTIYHVSGHKRTGSQEDEY